MTYAQVATLFGRFHTASTWPGTNPRVFHFHRDGGGNIRLTSLPMMEKLVIFECHSMRCTSTLNELA